MKSDYFTIEIRYPDKVLHNPVSVWDIRHSIMIDNLGVKVVVKKGKSFAKRKGNYHRGKKR